MTRKTPIGVLLLSAALASGALAQVSAAMPTTQPCVYMVSTAHLDTQWLWTIQDTIRSHIPKTMRENLALIEKYPDYRFNFEGAFRYGLMKEYYPQEYEKVRSAIAAGRWNVCGSWWDAVDTNLPSPESLVRQTLYGNGYFEKEFGKSSVDVFLPDCFGFSGTIPVVARHCGLSGFSTQKLTWGSAYGVPFDIGEWKGLGGAGIFAALDPGAYGSTVGKDLSKDADLLGRTRKQEQRSGLAIDYRYYGTGDTGGAPTDASAAWVQKSVESDGPLKVISASADQLYRDLADRDTSHLPVYQGELLMTAHGTGCYTSQSAMKRWNRQNEVFGQMAESAAVGAQMLGAMPYPADQLESAWKRFLWHQFHDDVTGTSIPQVYQFSWNDELIAQKQFVGVLEDATSAVADQLDTHTKGIPVVLYNALPWERRAEVTVPLDLGGTSEPFVEAWTGGTCVPATIVSRQGQKSVVSFAARVPAMGYIVYDIRPTDERRATVDRDVLRCSTNLLENQRLRVEITAEGDIAQITDKVSGRALLSAPIRLQMLDNVSNASWPAWELSYKDLSAAPRLIVGGTPRIRAVSGGDSVALEIVRPAEDSAIVQTIRLAQGSSRVEVDTVIDWKSKATTLKAAFPLAVSNERALYDTGIGTIARPTDTAKLYEVPAQNWAGIADANGAGVVILSDSRFGWDKPNGNTLRLTLVNTPAAPKSFAEQATNDIGRHHLRYAICAMDAHELGGVYRQAQEFSTPVVAMQTGRHSGRLGASCSFVQVSNPGVKLMALKRAQDGNDVVLRVANVSGEDVSDCRISIGGRVISAQACDGMERPLAGLKPQPLVGSPLTVSLKPYEIQTWRLSMNSARDAHIIKTRPVPLPLTQRVTTARGESLWGLAGSKSDSIPEELWPDSIRLGNVPFVLTSASSTQALPCRGQRIDLPGGDWDAVQILAGAIEPADVVFALDGKRDAQVHVSPFVGRIGQWDSRIVNGRFTAGSMKLSPAFCNPDRIAWTFTHIHDAQGSDAPYTFAHLFVYELRDGKGIRSVRLPDDPRVKVIAMTAIARGNLGAKMLTPLVDQYTSLRITSDASAFTDSATVRIVADRPVSEIRYTTDGTTPTEASPRYSSPVDITESCTVKATVLDGSGLPPAVAEATFTKLRPLAALAVKPMNRGLHWRYIEGSFGNTATIAKQGSTAEGDAAEISVAPAKRQEQFALEFTGYYLAPSEGVYRFFTGSDDGSRLWIGEQLVVDNDGMHSYAEASGVVILRAGWHPIRVAYIQGAVEAKLDVAVQEPGKTRRALAGEMLGHD